MDLIIRVVRFIVVTIIIGAIVRIVMALLGIDKKLDGKNKHWDSYRKQEAKARRFTGKCMRKTGEALKKINEEMKEEVVKTKDAYVEGKELTKKEHDEAFSSLLQEELEKALNGPDGPEKDKALKVSALLMEKTTGVVIDKESK